MTFVCSLKKFHHVRAHPDLRTETLREAISEAYHANWFSHSRFVREDKKDEAAGKKLKRVWTKK